MPTGRSSDGRLDSMLGNKGIKATKSGMLCGYAAEQDVQQHIHIYI